MNARDLILVSVDDHLVEPPHLFEGRLPARFADAAPEGRAEARRLRRVGVQRLRDPQHRLERRRGAAQGGVRHRAHRLRRDAAGLLRRARADQGHERGRGPGVDVLPLVPRLQRPPVRRLRGQGTGTGRAAGVQRLAHRRVVRRLPRAVHPDGAAGAVGSRAGGRRGPTRGGQRLPLHHLHREPGHARLPQLPRRRTGTRCGRPSATRGSSCPSTWARPASWRSRHPTRPST